MGDESIRAFDSSIPEAKDIINHHQSMLGILRSSLQQFLASGRLYIPQLGNDLTYHVDFIIVSDGLELALVLVANGIRGRMGDFGLGGIGTGLRRAAFGVWLATGVVRQAQIAISTGNELTFGHLAGVACEASCAVVVPVETRKPYGRRYIWRGS